jgi:hypothetical protein
MAWPTPATPWEAGTTQDEFSAILKDNRIGAYGAVAITVSIRARLLGQLGHDGTWALPAAWRRVPGGSSVFFRDAYARGQRPSSAPTAAKLVASLVSRPRRAVNQGFLDAPRAGSSPRDRGRARSRRLPRVGGITGTLGDRRSRRSPCSRFSPGQADDCAE